METAGGDHDGFVSDSIDEPMLVIEASAPPAFEFMTQRLGLADAGERIASSFVDEADETLEKFWLLGGHFGEVLPRIRVKAHGSHWNIV